MVNRLVVSKQSGSARGFGGAQRFSVVAIKAAFRWLSDSFAEGDWKTIGHNMEEIL